MRFKPSFTFAALALYIAAFASAGAQAAIIHVSYTGTITNGFDTTGVFGTANASLTGDSVGVVFTFDTSQGTVSNGATFSQLDGGGSGNAVVTINNHSVTIPGVTSSLLRNQDNGFGNRFTHDNVTTFFFDPSTFVSQNVDVQVFDPSTVIPVSILQPYSLIVGVGQGNGQFEFNDHQPFQQVPFDHEDLASGSFSVNTLTVSLATVPLPATLPLFATGLGIMGLIGWRSKQRSAAIAAA